MARVVASVTFYRSPKLWSYNAFSLSRPFIIFVSLSWELFHLVAWSGFQLDFTERFDDLSYLRERMIYLFAILASRISVFFPAVLLKICCILWYLFRIQRQVFDSRTNTIWELCLSVLIQFWSSIFIELVRYS